MSGQRVQSEFQQFRRAAHRSSPRSVKEDRKATPL